MTGLTASQGETIMLLNRNCSFAVGGVYSPMDFAYVTSMADTDSSLSYGIWNGQAANCFIPMNKIGISSKASQKEAAEKFVQYLFSEEGQTVSQKDGFPVVESVYDGEDYWNQGEEGKVLGSGYRDNSETGQGVEYKIVVPSADKVDALKQLGKTLTTPILDNAIITSAVSEAGVRYLNGEIGLDEAAKCSDSAGESVSCRVNLIVINRRGAAAGEKVPAAAQYGKYKCLKSCTGK